MPTARTNGLETYYERRGNGPPVVFIHAAILDHRQWEPQVDALADDYATISYDLRGHGRTGASAVTAYTIDRFAEDLRALLAALDLERPVLCGLSMGGLIAQTFAASYPDRASGLILADTFTPRILTRGEWFLRRIALRAVVGPVRLVGYERIEKANVWLAERLISGAGGNYGEIERLRETGPGMTAAEFGKVMRAIARFHESTIDLSAVTAPTLVLYGEHDLPFVERHASALAARVDDVEVEEVPAAGHASNLDNPEYFTATVREFLENVPVADGTDGAGDDAPRRAGDW